MPASSPSPVMRNASLVPVIAIDGPSASGKGTVAQGVASVLGFHYLNSGALYRTVAVAAIEAGIDLENESRVSDITLKLKANFSGDTVELDGRDISQATQTEEDGTVASRIAALPKVRSALLERQRAFRRPPGLVADGRDMGTVVFPDAVLKVYLTASPQVRAERRYKQLIDKGIHANLAALSRELEERDQRDADRVVAPLRPAKDAVLLDSSALSIEQVVDLIVSRFRERTSGKA